MSIGDNIYQYYHPKCCDPCSLLSDYESEYYQVMSQLVHVYIAMGRTMVVLMINMVMPLVELVVKVMWWWWW